MCFRTYLHDRHRDYEHTRHYNFPSKRYKVTLYTTSDDRTNNRPQSNGLKLMTETMNDRHTGNTCNEPERYEVKDVDGRSINNPPIYSRILCILSSTVCQLRVLQSTKVTTEMTSPRGTMRHNFSSC